MEQRGRKSVARLSVVNPDGVVSVPRIAPPLGMPDDQAQVWAAVVGSKPADWFDASHIGTLAHFCQHTARAARLSAMIEQLEESDEIDLEKYTTLLRAHEVQSRAASSLATRMRLTQQSTYSARKNSTVATNKKPWQGD